MVLLYAGVRFKTYSGLPFTYEIRKGRNGQYTKELWIDRRENSKSLAWSSVLLALGHIKKVGEIVERPKALGDIRGDQRAGGSKRKDEESVQQIVLTRMPQRVRKRRITQCLRSLRDPEITQKIRLRNEPQATEITL